MKLRNIFAVAILTSLCSFAGAQTKVIQTLTYSLGKKDGVRSVEVNKLIKDYNKTSAEKLKFVPNKLVFDGKSANPYWDISSYVDELSEKLGQSVYLETMDPSNELTCYRGQGADVLDLVSSMTDGPYSDQMTIYYAKYKDQVLVGGEDELDFGDGKIDMAQVNKSNENVGILFTTSDGGDDYNSVIISKCK